MWTPEVTDMIIRGIGETLYMTILSTALGYLFGLPMGVLMAVTDKGGLSMVAAAIPFIARLVESSVKEVDAGVVEAAKSMGAGNFRIIVRVLLVEARTSLITGMTIAAGTILGYSAMAGTVGGGGLGDIAVRYGYYRWKTDIMIATVILLILLVQIFQSVGMVIAGRLDKRK